MGRPKGSKTKKVKEVVEAVAPIDSYKATIKIMARTYTATGTSVLDALSQLVVLNAKGKSILTIEKGDIKKEKVIMPLPTMRLFNTRGISREVALKNVSLMFGGL